jgi:thioredoxin 1
MPQDLLVDRPGLFIACLCAEWCGACREYRAVFESAHSSGAEATGDVRVWIDIEDHAGVPGDLEIETFPTLLIGDRTGRVFFYGSVTPHARTLERLLQGARAGELAPIEDAAVVELAERARAFASSRLPRG